VRLQRRISISHLGQHLVVEKAKTTTAGDSLQSQGKQLKLAVEQRSWRPCTARGRRRFKRAEAAAAGCGDSATSTSQQLAPTCAPVEPSRRRRVLQARGARSRWGTGQGTQGRTLGLFFSFVRRLRNRRRETYRAEGEGIAAEATREIGQKVGLVMKRACGTRIGWRRQGGLALYTFWARGFGLRDAHTQKLRPAFGLGSNPGCTIESIWRMTSGSHESARKDRKEIEEGVGCRTKREL